MGVYNYDGARGLIAQMTVVVIDSNEYALGIDATDPPESNRNL